MFANTNPAPRRISSHMPRAELTVTVPDGVWIGELSRQYARTRIRILSAFADGDSGVGLLELAGEDVEAFVEGLAGQEEIETLTPLSRTDERALVQFETSMPLLLFPIQGSGVPLELPFDLQEGEASWEITASHERLSKLGEQLEEFDIPYKVETVRERIEDEQLLTDRQRRLLRTAVESGYYDTPRDCTLTELAEAVGIAKSTCSETLHRAEGKVIKRFVERLAP
jgi:predicted DNA-binding protein YlxM (UPF0122 family)